MTHQDGTDRSTLPQDADRLNACLDRLARGHRDDDYGLDPSLMATVDAVALLGAHEAARSPDPDSVGRSWTTLLATSPGVDSPRWRDRGVKLGLVASPAGFPSARQSSWPMGLVSAVAAVLLVAIVASHDAGLPGSPSTSTVMAAGAPTVVPTETVEPEACLVKHETVVTASPITPSETGLILTMTAGSNVVVCSGSGPSVDVR